MNRLHIPRLLVPALVLGVATFAGAEDQKSPADVKAEKSAAALKKSVVAEKQKTAKPDVLKERPGEPREDHHGAAAIERAKAEILKAIAELRSDMAGKLPQVKDEAQAAAAELKDRLAQALKENEELRARLRKAEAAAREARVQLEAALDEARRQAALARAEAELSEFKRARLIEAEQRKKDGAEAKPSGQAAPKKPVADPDTP